MKKYSIFLITFFCALTVRAEEDIRDIRGPVPIVTEWGWLWWVLVAVLLVAALWFFLATRKKMQKPPRVLLPHERALEALEKAKGWIEKNEIRKFSYAVSEIVRNYIETRFQVSTAHQTTDEFLSQLVQSINSPLWSHRELLQNFLNQCDMVKFANQQMAQQEAMVLFGSAQDFIQQTATQGSISQEPTTPPQISLSKQGGKP